MTMQCMVRIWSVSETMYSVTVYSVNIEWRKSCITSVHYINY